MKVLPMIISTLCFFCLPFVAHAEQPCSDSAKDWQCFGQIDMKTRLNEGDGPRETVLTRWTFFDHGEELVQIEEDGYQLRFLKLPSAVILYSGKGNFKEGFNEMAIVAPVYVAFDLLVSAYPSGPESVPDGTTTKAFKAYGGAASETITTTRSGSSHITFQIGDDKSPLNLSGSWDSALAKYHPEEFDLSGWNKSGKDVFKKLIEARASGVSNATKSEGNKEVE